MRFDAGPICFSSLMLSVSASVSASRALRAFNAPFFPRPPFSSPPPPRGPPPAPSPSFGPPVPGLVASSPSLPPFSESQTSNSGLSNANLALILGLVGGVSLLVALVALILFIRTWRRLDLEENPIYESEKNLEKKDEDAMRSNNSGSRGRPDWTISVVYDNQAAETLYTNPMTEDEAALILPAPPHFVLPPPPSPSIISLASYRTAQEDNQSFYSANSARSSSFHSANSRRLSSAGGASAGAGGSGAGGSTSSGRARRILSIHTPSGRAVSTGTAGPSTCKTQEIYLDVEELMPPELMQKTVLDQAGPQASQSVGEEGNAMQDIFLQAMTNR